MTVDRFTWRGSSGVVIRQRVLTRRQVLFCVLTLAGAAIFFSLWWSEKKRGAALDHLIAASALAGYRTIPQRLSLGIPWAPLRVTRGSDPAPFANRTKFIMAAAAAFQEEEHAPSASVHHTAALAYVLTGQPRRALQSLETLSSNQPDASIWSDVAAVESIIAEQDHDPSRLARSLAAADAALRMNPRCAEAHFNRALVLETLGLRDQARTEWGEYLRLDPSGDWANEARAHERNLRAQMPFQPVFSRWYTSLLANPSLISPLAQSDRQAARIAAEEEILGDWGEAFIGGRDVEAARLLAIARAIGVTLANEGGDGMLPAMVAAIDSGGDGERTLLAHAHFHFREGRLLYRSRDLHGAELALTTAAAEFSQGRSPGELMACAFAANTIYEEGRLADAEKRLLVVLERTPARFPALRAQILWEQGGVALARGRWGDCIAALTDSLSIFERLEERNYAATVRGVLVYVYDRIGQPSLAWKHRIISLRELGQTPSFRLQEALDSVASAALMDEQWPVALSFLGLEIELARSMTIPLAHIGALLKRGEVNVHIGRRDEAAADVAEARRIFATLPDAADRAHFDANAKAVEASLTDNPATSVALLTDAIAFHSTIGRRMHLPQLFMNRGRAYRAMRDDARAAQDFEMGIAELERYRESLPDGEDRWGVFHAADDLFGAAIALSLDHHDPAKAFQYAERARARALLDSLGSHWPRVSASDVPAGTVIIEYAVREDAIVLFVLDQGGVHAVTRPIDRKTLIAEIAAFNKAGANADAGKMRQLSRSLYRCLIEPVQERLFGNTTVAIVPDARLGEMPFAALIDDGGTYLIQRYAIEIEPSAAVFARLPTARSSQGERQVLVVSGDDGLGRLAGADREADAVAAVYPRALRLTSSAATPAAFESSAALAEVVHFTGHAVASTGGTHAGYLLLRSDAGSEGQLVVKRIAGMHFPRTSLIVLAACSTAAGEIRSTEGTISAARAFLAAGVPAVVATLLPIEDEPAADFFPSFHRRLAEGLRPAEALRQTQIDCIRKSGCAGLWNAVVIIGE